jgi:hypothetical protein
VRFSRFLNSSHVTAAEMLGAAAGHCAKRVAGRHVLAIQDTSEINYQAHAGRVKGLGPTGNGSDLGFFIHPVLAVEAGHGGILGLAGGSIWARSGKAGKPRRKRPIEDKESQRWIDGARTSSQTLAGAVMVTVVCDREGDIYDLIAEPRRPNHHLLVRSAQDRGLAEGGSLHAHAERLVTQYRYCIDVAAKPGQPKRTATVGVGFGAVRLKRPQHTGNAGLPETVAMTLVAVREIAPPDGAEPVRWLLLTTHPAETLEAALAIVGWYRKRWLIEQLFRLMKTQGLDVEESQVVAGHALMNLVTVALIAAMQTLQLTLARDGATQQPAGDAFPAAQTAILAAILRSLPGKTAAQSNPHAQGSLAWAAWIIARLGGWTGYASQKPPGPKTMHLGLKEYQTLAQGWLLCQKDK